MILHGFGAPRFARTRLLGIHLALWLSAIKQTAKPLDAAIFYETCLFDSLLYELLRGLRYLHAPARKTGLRIFRWKRRDRYGSRTYFLRNYRTFMVR